MPNRLWSRAASAEGVSPAPLSGMICAIVQPAGCPYLSCMSIAASSMSSVMYAGNVGPSGIAWREHVVAKTATNRQTIARAAATGAKRLTVAYEPDFAFAADAAPGRLRGAFPEVARETLREARPDAAGRSPFTLRLRGFVLSDSVAKPLVPFLRKLLQEVPDCLA